MVVTPEQMVVILNELDTLETRLEWMLALLHAATALRPEESFGLNWEDLNWKAEPDSNPSGLVEGERDCAAKRKSA